MTSSIMAGEKKWSSKRRSMTVLGKVAVPKPLNLPSQKLENHGLDPNVEIVPKGTIGWGSQSSSVPNAWGSSSGSPKADGSTLSPSHFNGRPSSGSGTRPSTGGSERMQEANPSGWGQNSRPTSASGALTSNQTANNSLRPRSAETRPGSSHLSRFAEPPPPENSLAWGPTGSSNKLGVRPSNSDGFALSSGDFPTLGSEKDGTQKNIDPEESGYNSRPGSSSSRPASGKEKNPTSSVGNIMGESTNTWTRDGSQHPEYGVHPALERWQGDMPPGGNPHRPPQHFDAWRGHPVNHPPRGWYPGHPMGPPPYGHPVHPSGYPMEPYPFYPPQRPPNNSQQVPPGGNPRGQFPKTGEFRPHVPEGYIHPRVPINPGFYPPPYEGFYGPPPMGYHNPNERDMPFMGRPPGPPVYKRHPYDNNAMDPHSRSPVHGLRVKPSTPEQMEPRTGHFDDRGPYKVLLKNTKDNWNEKKAEGEWDHGVPSKIEKKSQPGSMLQKNEWGLEDDKGNCPLDSAYNMGNKPGNESSFPQSSQILSASQKSSTLMQKIDSLNSKSRNFDGRPDVASLPYREGQNNQLHTSRGGPLRRPSHDAQGRVDHRGKRLNNQDAEGWRKNPTVGESSAEISVMNVEHKPNVLVCDRPDILEGPGKFEVNLQGKDDGDNSTLFYDETDNIAQRAKMRELAKQRAERLQKEEEERTREQKAKALAKLEELNRKLEKGPPAQKEEEKSPKTVEYNNSDSSKSEILDCKDHIRASNSIMVGKNKIVFDGPPLEKSDHVRPKSEVAINEASSQVSDGNVSKHKSTEYKERQNLNLAKNVTQKLVPLTQTSENITNEVASSGEVTSSDVMTDTSTQNKRKINRSNKNRHKVDEVPPVSIVPPIVGKETNAAKISAEKPEQNPNLPQSKVVEQLSSFHPWKPQQPRHTPRNQQGNTRVGEREKSHSRETGTWAPVRSQDKMEPTDKPGNKSESGIDATNAKLESVVQNNMKTKRAEMERYVPKPVAKELAQQGSVQEPVVAQNSENTQKSDSAHSGSLNADMKQKKSEKAHGPYKQRVYVESALNQGSEETVKNVQRPIEQNQSLKSDLISSKEEYNDGWNSTVFSDVKSSKEQTTDGWNINDNYDTSASNNMAVTKVPDVPSRGNRYPYKGKRSVANNFELDHRNASREPIDEINQMDKNSSLKDNRFVGERTSKWQPKSQVYSGHNRQNRPNEEQMDVPAIKAQVDQAHSEPVQNVVHQDYKRERKPSSSRGRPFPSAESDFVYANKDQQFASEFRKNGNNNNNRSGRGGQEPRGDAPYSRERPRQASHLEYQPVGQYGNNKPNKIEEGSMGGSHNMGPKYKERNQGYPSRGGGNFYGRQGGAGHRDARYD